MSGVRMQYVNFTESQLIGRDPITKDKMNSVEKQKKEVLQSMHKRWFWNSDKSQGIIVWHRYRYLDV